MKLQAKMKLLVLSTGLATLTALSAIMVYSMFVTRDMAVQYGKEIGQQSQQNSSILLVDEKQRELVDIAADRADDINYRLRDMEKTVRTAAAAMQHIQAHPDDYRPRSVAPPPAKGAGQYTFYVQYAPNVNVQALRREMGIAAHIRDTLLGLVQCDPLIDSLFVTSRDNYTFSVDNNTTTTAAEYAPPDVHYDALASDWYRLAVQKRGPIFTPVREFLFSKELGIFCAMPYYDARDELLGVACLQTTLTSLAKLVDEINLHSNGFCFVLDEGGRVILSTHKDAAKTPGILSVNLHADLRQSENAALADTAKRMLRGARGLAEIDLAGKEYHVAWAPIAETGWSFAAAIPTDEIMDPIVRNKDTIQRLTQENVQELNNHMAATLSVMLAMLLALVGIVWLVGRRVSDRFVQPIHVLTEGVRDITAGNLNKKIHLHTNDEIEHLAACFNDMTDSLKKTMEDLDEATLDKERQNAELQERNAALSLSLRIMERLRSSRDAYRTESEIDQLTRVYNKATAVRLCTKLCAGLAEGMQAALYIIDLDHFKEANDTFGHQFGDRILETFAQRLKLLCRNEDCVGRFGGDEFVVMLAGGLSDDVIRTKARAILQAARDLCIDGQPAGITASIGIAIAPRHGKDYAVLFQTADKALYRVKEQGRNGFCLGTAEVA